MRRFRLSGWYDDPNGPCSYWQCQLCGTILQNGPRSKINPGVLPHLKEEHNLIMDDDFLFPIKPRVIR